MKYPLLPKSTIYLEQGQFWSVPLAEDKYSCGVVLAIVTREDKKDSRIFLAGLLDWFGESIPTSSDIINCSVLEKGYVHIKTITETGGSILGQVDLNLNAPTIVNYSDNTSTWGYNFITKLATKINKNS